MIKTSQVWNHMQTNLFPFMAEELGSVTEAQQKLISILELIRIEDFIPARWWRLGRPPQDRVALANSAMLDDLPRVCDWGTKKKNGKTYHWKGYKLHVDWADGEIPVSAILTSASVNDSQAAIPLAAMSAARVQSLYDLMDAAYDAEAIRSYSLLPGHVPIIDRNPRGGESVEMAAAEKRRYDERSTAERGFSMFKEGFGGRQVRVRGHAKVPAHLMFGLLALTAERLLNLL